MCIPSAGTNNRRTISKAIQKHIRQQSRAKRLDAIEQRVAVQGDSMSYRIANVGDLAVTNFKKISAIEQQGVILAQRCEMRITSIEERLAALEKLETNDNWK